MNVPHGRALSYNNLATVSPTVSEADCVEYHHCCSSMLPRQIMSTDTYRMTVRPIQVIQ